MKTTLTTLFCLALLIAGCGTYEDSLNSVPVLSGNTEAGRAVYQTYSCDACHGADGQTPALGVSRIIADLNDPRDVENALLVLQLPESNREGAMKSVAASLNAQEIADVAAFVASSL